MTSHTASSNESRSKVFSSRQASVHHSGTGYEQPKKYWLVQADANSALSIRPLDEETWLPTGKGQPISAQELQKRYTPEPGLFEQKVQPKLAKYEGSLTLLAAPQPSLPPLDEKALQSDFKKGIALVNKGDLEKGKSLFEAILKTEAQFEEKHKHMFNEFAIQLRKCNLPAQAIAFYTRAIDLSWGEQDENLHINLARVLYAEKQYASCVQHLFDALGIVPGHRVARSFLAWLEQQKVIPTQYSLQVKGYLNQKPNENGEYEELPPLEATEDVPADAPSEGPETSGQEKHDSTGHNSVEKDNDPVTEEES